MATERSLTVVPERMEIVRPAVSPDEALKAWAEYQAMKKALATPEDIQVVETKAGPREFLKKSYWRKVERFYRIDLACVQESHEDTLQGQRIFYATYRASHPSGAYCDGDGLDFAGTIEEYHNARATAHTRAKNRAIADLVGGGEVSAEEVGPALRQRPSQSPEQLAEFWCKEHNTAWFMRGKMKSYGHPRAPGEEWCQKPATAQPEPVEGQDVDEALAEQRRVDPELWR